MRENLIHFTTASCVPIQVSEKMTPTSEPTKNHAATNRLTKRTHDGSDK